MKCELLQSIPHQIKSLAACFGCNSHLSSIFIITSSKLSLKVFLFFLFGIFCTKMASNHDDQPSILDTEVEFQPDSMNMMGVTRSPTSGSVNQLSSSSSSFSLSSSLPSLSLTSLSSSFPSETANFSTMWLNGQIGPIEGVRMTSQSYGSLNGHPQTFFNGFNAAFPNGHQNFQSPYGNQYPPQYTSPMGLQNGLNPSGQSMFHLNPAPVSIQPRFNIPKLTKDNFQEWRHHIEGAIYLSGASMYVQNDISFELIRSDPTKAFLFTTAYMLIDNNISPEVRQNFGSKNSIIRL